MSDTIATFTKTYLKKSVPQIHAGDTVRVHTIVREGTKERIQVFEGVVIACKGGQGVNATFTVRKISFRVGVERIFPLHSPRIVKVERVKSSNVRRAKLYYLRGLTGKSARLKQEKLDPAMWEEKGAEEQIEAIEEAVAEDAIAHAEEKEEHEGEVVVEKNEAMPDEVKADIAAGEPAEVVAEAKEVAETPEEVAHNEAVDQAPEVATEEPTETKEA